MRKEMIQKAFNWLREAAEKERLCSPLSAYYRERASKCFRRAARL